MINKSKIDWPFQPLYTINTTIGCPRNCFDGKCWARSMNDRFKWVEDFNKINHLKEFPTHIPGKGKYILVGGMSDIWYWDRDYLQDVIEKCSWHGGVHTFIFLTKSPIIYAYYAFPSNCMLGVTITGEESWEDLAIKYERLSDRIGEISGEYFLSIEPLLGNVELFEKWIDYVIVGAMADGSVKPEKEWIKSIKNKVPEEKIYWKKNIRRYL